jgi:hypothetical protein
MLKIALFLLISLEIVYLMQKNSRQADIDQISEEADT